MITRVQGKTLAGEIAVRKEPKLSAMEKAMLRWAVIDPKDRVLDAKVGSGMMAEYLRRNMQCEVCGVSDQMDHVRSARQRLQSCDIVYAPAGDIPWREEAFDAVLMKITGEETELLGRMLAEAYRVLRPGGQLVLGGNCYPPLIHQAVCMLADEREDMRMPFQKQQTQKLLFEQRFEKITWQRTGVAVGVMIAWKPVAESACWDQEMEK